MTTKTMAKKQVSNEVQVRLDAEEKLHEETLGKIEQANNEAVDLESDRHDEVVDKADGDEDKLSAEETLHDENVSKQEKIFDDAITTENDRHDAAVEAAKNGPIFPEVAGTGKFQTVKVGDVGYAVYNPDGLRVSDVLPMDKAQDIARRQQLAL